MNFLLISGPQNCGKTSLLNSLFTHYTTAGGWTPVNYIPYIPGPDFRAILQKSGRTILMQSDTDLPGCIQNLKNYYAQYPGVDTIITSCRSDPDPMRYRLFNDLNINAAGNYHFEVPLGRMPSGAHRTAAINWYSLMTEKIAVMAGAAAPFSL